MITTFFSAILILVDLIVKKEIKVKSDNISAWYNDVVVKARLADYGPVKGTMIILPYGYALWENVQSIMDKMFKAYGIENAYFPLFIPMAFLKREKDHVKGFSPELAIVTVGGGEELKDPVAVRPTSETIMYDMYAKWIQSWRDLPILMNQWNNVVRWEKRTYLFLRTSEFLWQEGHTAHATEEEAIDMAKTALEWYRQIYEDYYAMPVIMGIKSAAEKFAGAKTTYTIEALMPDGKALQGATSHNLGQNFATAFNISFQNKEGKNDFVWQTSWGFSTRSLGGLFLTHGDDQGLIIPPKIAPIKAVIIPVLGNDSEKVLSFCHKVKAVLDSAQSLFVGQVKLWDEPWKTMGWKANEAELKGIPVRIMIGLAEADNNCVTVKTRISLGSVPSGPQLIKGVWNDRGISVDFKDIDRELDIILDKIQKLLFEKAKKFLDENTHVVNNYDQFKSIMSKMRGFLKAFWCEDPVCEVKIKEETKASTRCLSLSLDFVQDNDTHEHGQCVYCGKPAKYRWVFAQAY